jgi:hypothetical protein
LALATPRNRAPLVTKGVWNNVDAGDGAEEGSIPSDYVINNYTIFVILTVKHPNRYPLKIDTMNPCIFTTKLIMLTKAISIMGE